MTRNKAASTDNRGRKGHRVKTGDKLKKLSKKEEKFVIEYTTHFNATRAAINAGLSSSANRAVAGVVGCNLLKKYNVKSEIEKQVQAIITDKEELRARVIEEYKALAFSDIKDVVDYDGRSLTVNSFDDIDTRAVQSIERQPVVTNSQGVVDHVIKVKLHEKKGALDSLARYLQMLKDDVGVTVNINYESIKKSLEDKLLK
jgi:phage terminase small subunit